MTGPYTRKRREKCVLFLDDAFGAKEAPRKLAQAGYPQVEPFVAHFKRDDGTKEESVKDPRVIHLCEKNGWILVTTDSDIRHTHVEIIKTCSNLAIFATAHNSAGDIDPWVDALILAKPRLEKEFKKRKRPWYAQYNRQGHITTIYTITSEHKTRRIRPKETGSAKAAKV